MFPITRHGNNRYIFQEGVIVVKKDPGLVKHPDVDVPNLQVMMITKSLRSREYVREGTHFPVVVSWLLFCAFTEWLFVG